MKPLAGKLVESSFVPVDLTSGPPCVLGRATLTSLEMVWCIRALQVTLGCVFVSGVS